MGERVVYLNGEIVPESEARVSIFDAGFRSGDGVYEVTRTFAHRPFRLRDHLHRLAASLKYTRIDCGLGLDELERISLDVLDRNIGLLGESEDYAIWQNVSRGIGGAFGGPGKTTVAIYCVPVALAGVAESYVRGIDLVTPSTRRTPPQSLEAKAKITNKMNHIVALHEARQVSPDSMPLMLDIDGNVAETHMANFFLVSGGTVRTPSARNVLGGITRTAVLELARQLNMMTEEGTYTPHDVYTAEEAFVTGTSASILPVRQLNGIAIGESCPGPQTLRLIDGWNRMVGVDIVEQAFASLDADRGDALRRDWAARRAG